MKKLLLLNALLTTTACALSQAATIQLGNDGQLDIDIPATWKTTVKGGASGDKMDYNIELSPGDDTAFSCKINLVADPKLASMTKKDLYAEARQAAMIQSLITGESGAPLIPLNIKDGFGTYFMLTLVLPDEKPSQSGGRKAGTQLSIHNTQFYMKYGKCTTANVTLHAMDINSVEYQTIKNAIIGMRPALTPPAPTPKVKITKIKQGTQLSNAAVSTKLIIPSTSLKEKKERIGGNQDNPGYFYIEDTKSGVLMSGWFDLAGKFKYPSARKLWDAENAAGAKNGAPEAENMEYQKIGAWDVWLYDLPTPAMFRGVCSSHLRANYLDGETWIDVHLSLTQKAQIPVLRDKLIAYLKTFAITDAKPGK